MKDKPTSHKNQNTFHFLTFAERLNNVNIDVIRRVGKRTEFPEDENTFFQEAIEKWNDLNYTEDYGALQREIGTEIRTLSQIVFRQEEIIEILLKQLQSPESMALDATLEFIVALARDLQFDFYPHFPKFFLAITELLITKDTDLLERLFTCLSYLFKFLWRYMVKDIKNVYSLFSVLLTDDNKEHIRNFAAESFAFLMRKVSDKSKLFQLVFQILEDNPEQADGVGQLLFEVVKGVKEQFHSCTKVVFKLMLKCLGQGLREKTETVTELPSQLIEQALTQMLSSMAKHTSKAHGIIVQEVLCETLSQLLYNFQSENLPQHSVAEHLNHVLHLLLFWVNYRDGLLITSNAEIIEILIKLCKEKDLPECCFESVMEVVALLMISHHGQIQIKSINILIFSIFQSSFRKLTFEFTRKMFGYGMFEKDVLPSFLAHCIDALKNDPSSETSILQIFSELIINLKPLERKWENIKAFTKLQLYSPMSTQTGKEDNSLLSGSSNVLENFCLKILEDCKEVKHSDTLSKVWCSLVCLPHFRVLDMESTMKTIEHLVKNLHDSLIDLSIKNVGDEKLEDIAFVLCEAFICWICLGPHTKPLPCLTLQFFIDLIRALPKSVSILCMTDLYLKHYADLENSSNTEDTFGIIFPKLMLNLASPFHLVRLYTLHIINTFVLPLPSSEDEVTTKLSVFAICLEAEKIPINVRDYREKLKWLRKLEFPFVEKHLPTVLETECKKAPIYYLLGTLHINLSLLWQPTIELLQTFAQGMNKVFWDVFKLHLDENMELAEKFNLGGISCHSPLLAKSTEKEYLFCTTRKAFCQHTETPDVLNHRNLLWKAMGLFPNIVEPRNKDIVPLLFRFVTNEVAKVDSSLAVTETVNKCATTDNTEFSLNDENVCDRESESSDSENSSDSDVDHVEKLEKHKFSGKRKRHSKNSILDDVENKEGSEMVCDESEDGINKSRRSITLNKTKKTINSGIKKRQGVARTLAAILSLFSKFKNPKALYRTDELQALYYELLSYQDLEIQKLSFDCIMTYNYKYLVPYKDNFYKILDDKSFKSEIVLFSLDKDNEVIQEDHRMKALAVLMRILYGKMMYKTGSNTSGKSQANVRRSLVLRFLAGCKAEELKMFFELVFAPFKEQLKGDVLSVVRNIRQNLDLSLVVPIRKQRSAVNVLELILQHLGSLVPELLPWLLKVLLVITTTSVVLLERRQELLPQCLTPLKLVRTNAVMRLIQYFKSFDHYNFSPEEIDAIFEAIVWPMLPRLEFEALHRPPPLLRLFDTWSSNSRFFILLAKHHESSMSLSPLPHLMSLYTADRAQPRVIGLLSKMLLQLLTLQDYEPTDLGGVISETIQINNCLQIPITSNSVDDLTNFGTHLLIPHIAMVMKRIHSTVARTAKNPRRSLLPRDLTILLRISVFVNDSEQCTKMIQLLLPFLTKQLKINTDSEVLILSTICNLIKQVESPKMFVKIFAPLFAVLSSQRSRTSLTAVFKTIAEKDEDIQELASIVEKINAWNPNFVDEPDYQMRLDGQTQALQIINQMSQVVDEEFMRIIVLNSAFMIKTCDDLSLRDSASYLLQQLVKKFSEFSETLPSNFKVLVFDTLLPEIQTGLKNKTEVVRCEFIRILATLLHNCGTHPRLSGLAQLCDKDQDMDFWENILHLQVHRRARALLRFAGRLTSGEVVMSPHILITYLMPIVSSFLFDPTYRKHVHVVDAAIDTLGSIVRTFPWTRYEPVLRYYLGLLSKNAEHHKTVVKIIVAVLDAFHFDLSASQGIRGHLKGKQNKKVEKLLQNEETSIGTKESTDDILAPDFTDLPKDDSKEHEDPKKNEVTDADKATKIHQVIAKSILPQLHKSLMHKTKNDDEHKLNKHFYPEDEEILRVPIALAMAKLLQNLPLESLKMNIPGLFLKMCHLLKSKAESIRETARDTIVKMMQSLGPNYFFFLLREMRSVMNKGYQVHVMTFTVNAILVNLKSQLKTGDLDSCVTDLTQICVNELFSDIAEEKEVTKITGKLKEARSSKSYSLYQILSQFISEEHLLDLISPLKEILSNARSHKIVKKVHECLRHAALGLSDNADLSIKGQLIFIHAVMSESVISLNPKRKKSDAVKEGKYVRPDIYLLPKEPGRSGPPAKTSIKTNAHILVEFGLQLLHFCLKRDKFKTSQQEHLEMLDPFIPILSDCLDSSYVKIISTTLRSLMLLFKFPLPSMETNVTKIMNSLFILLNKYAGVGMGQGDNFEMVVMCFKMLTTVVRDTNYCKLSDEQLHVLLSYIEQDIFDHTRQATAFTLLKAILSKKLPTSELPGIMSKIAEMSITSEQDHVRAQCRQVSLQYMLDYPLGKRLQQSLGFIVNQLEYSHEHGRVSAIEMINSILGSFPVDIIRKHSGLFLVPLAARLVNDEAVKCRKMVALTIKNMLKKVGHDERKALFSIALTWLQNKKLSHSRLGAQLCGLFVEIEGEQFDGYLDEFLLAILEHLENTKMLDVQSHTDERCTDHFLYHLLNLLMKVLSNCTVIRNIGFADKMNSIWGQLQKLILHPHAWVRLASSQLFGLFFSSYTVEELLDSSTSVFFYNRQKLRDLSADFATQLQSPYLNETLGEQVIRNLVYLAKVISRLPEDDCNGSDAAEKISEHEQKTEVTLPWMIRKLCREVKKEVAQSPHNSIKRKCVFKFLAAVSLDLGKEKIYPLLCDIFTPLCRELSDSSTTADESLKTLAQEVLDLVKKLIGVEEFTKNYASVQSTLFRKKAKRKQERVVEAVTNPEKYANKKIKKQLNKKEAKKRKILKQKGQKKAKKFKLTDLAFES